MSTALAVGTLAGTVAAHIAFTVFERSYDNRGRVYQAWERRTTLPTTPNPYTKTNR